MTTSPVPPAMRPQPGAEALAAIEDTLARIDDHIEVIRDLLTNMHSMAEDGRRRIAALKGKS